MRLSCSSCIGAGINDAFMHQHTLFNQAKKKKEKKISGARQTIQTVVFDFVFGFFVPNLNLKRSPKVFCHIVLKSLLRLEIGSLKVGSTLRKHSDLRSVGIFFRALSI